jgi:type VI secretion system protein ImpG
MEGSAAREVDAYQALARLFAKSAPAIAERLATPGSDPEAERIIEGFAYLARRVERVLESSAPAAALHFAQLIAPEVVRPFPSATIVELTPIGPLRGARREVDAGAEFDSIALDETRCRFRAHASFSIMPVGVDGARFTFGTDRRQALEITLSPLADGTTRNAFPLFPLRIHLGGEARGALVLLQCLAEHGAQIEVDVDGETRPLPGATVRPWGLSADEPLLPREPLEHPGIRLLREFFISPMKFSFVQIEGANLVVPTSAARLVLRIFFGAPLPLGMQLSRECVRVNCVPVVNGFESTSDPVRPSLARPEHVLRPAGVAPAHGEIYGVRAVTARLRDGREMPVPHATAFSARPKGALGGVFYELKGAPSAAGAGADVSIALGAPADCPPPPDLEALSLDVWATNRDLPSNLGVGDVRVTAPASPASVAFRNVMAVTPYRAAPHGVELLSRTLATCAMTARSLADKDTLAALLHTLNLHPLADAQAARAHKQRLSSLVAVSVTARAERLGDTVARGHDVEVRLAETGFDGDGEAFVFASVLARLFAHEASVNAFVRTTVQLTGTGRAFRFPALSGDTILG